MMALEFHITGRVQGVNFRAATKQKADEWNVKGWIANNADGSVTVHAEGPEQLLRDFEDWCRIGPTSASVLSLMVKPAPDERLDSFEVVY
jgi:acylphosphatase